MKKIILQLVAIISMPLMASAQADRVPNSNTSVNHSLAIQPSTPNSTNALFDLQFDYVLPRGGFAAITWTWSEFWISKWNSDSLFTVDDSTGAITSSFFITGVTGVRALTFDGNHIWVANNTSTIYKVDTLTHAVISTLTAPYDVRGLAFDNTNGGFWISNYDTDITLIDSVTGGAQNSVLAGAHGLVGMYGIAFDPFSTGGPYIWVFDQGVAGTSQDLVRIPIASGVPDLSHNIGLEVGGAGIAGGMAITGFANPGDHSIIGLSQDSPDRIFGYELGDYILPAYDAAADSLYFYPPTTQTPSFLITPINWDVITKNEGANTLDSLGVDLVVNDGTSNVHNATGYSFGVPSVTTSTVSIPGTFTPVATPGTNYTVNATINTGMQTDLVSNNDSLSYGFSITDTVMARHGSYSSRIGIGSGTGGTIGVLFDIPTTCFATSVTFTLGNPTIGDSVYAELFDWNGLTPGNQIARSAKYIITAADTGIAGNDLTLPLLNAPIQMTPASYLAGIHENNANVSIVYSLQNWRPNTTWIYLNSNSSWSPSEAFAIAAAKMVPFIELNIWSQNMVSVGELSNGPLTVYPNPASGEITIENPLSGKYELTVTDLQGRVIFSNVFDGKQRETIRTSEWNNGIYVARIQGEGKSFVSKLVISHGN